MGGFIAPREVIPRRIARDNVVALASWIITAVPVLAETDTEPKTLSTAAKMAQKVVEKDNLSEGEGTIKLLATLGLFQNVLWIFPIAYVINKAARSRMPF